MLADYRGVKLRRIKVVAKGKLTVGEGRLSESRVDTGVVQALFE